VDLLLEQLPLPWRYDTNLPARRLCQRSGLVVWQRPGLGDPAPPANQTPGKERMKGTPCGWDDR
jgi:hypothetical protein